MSRLTVNITQEERQSLEPLTALQGRAIEQYAIERLFPAGDGGDQA